MRVMFESWFVQNKVDIVFAGHVHSYERSVKNTNTLFNTTNIFVHFIFVVNQFQTIPYEI